MPICNCYSFMDLYLLGHMQLPRKGVKNHHGKKRPKTLLLKRTIKIIKFRPQIYRKEKSLPTFG